MVMNKTEVNVLTPLELLYKWEESQPDKGYLFQPIQGIWLSRTWKEAALEVRKMAAVIQNKNYPKGSRIAILSKNCMHWLMADYAVMMSGHISVPIYPNMHAAQVQYVLEHSESVMMFVGKLEQADWDEMRHGIPDTIDLISFGIYDLQSADYPSWDAVIKDQAPLEGNPRPRYEDIMTIIYTSGTTGLPKGVVHNYLAPSYAIEKFVEILEVGANERLFSYLPLSHIAERMLVSIGSLRFGCSVHFAESLQTFTDNLKTCKPTIFLSVPRIWTKFMMGIQEKLPANKLNLLLSLPVVNSIIKKKVQTGLGLGQARICISGAAPIAPSVQLFFRRLGIEVLNFYGMTENCAYSHANEPKTNTFGTVGPTLPGVDMKFTDEGEICLKCITNLVEYYKDPERTAEALQDGFFHTGDCGELDEKGFLQITGRVKDQFKTEKGKYVVPSPIEMKLSHNEFIEQVCVAGLGLPQPIALVVLSQDGRNKQKEELQESLSATLKEVNKTLDHHETLHSVVVVDHEWTAENGILTPTLKIKRNEIEKRYKHKYAGWYALKDAVVWESGR